MSLGTRLFARWFALPLVLTQLLLTGAAVPHCHAAAAAAGHGRAAEHSAPSARPHRHWAWAGHDNAEHGHAPDSSAPSGASEGDRSDPAEHDGDAIYLADGFGMAVTGPRQGAPGLMTAWVALPRKPAPVLTAATRHVWQAVRPPGDRLPSHHDLLPHVLRV